MSIMQSLPGFVFVSSAMEASHGVVKTKVGFRGINRNLYRRGGGHFYNIPGTFSFSGAESSREILFFMCPP